MRVKFKKLNKKAVAIVALCICLALCAVSGVWAYLISVTDPLENKFVPAKVTCEVEESFSGGVKSDVTVRNTGDVNAFIRATVVATYISSDDKVYSKAPIEGVDYVVNWSSNNKWKKGSDGFWYYSDFLQPNAATVNLIETATELSAPEGYTLNLQIIATAIQSEPNTAVQNAWGITPVNGTINPD